MSWAAGRQCTSLPCILLASFLLFIPPCSPRSLPPSPSTNLSFTNRGQKRLSWCDEIIIFFFLITNQPQLRETEKHIPPHTSCNILFSSPPLYSLRPLLSSPHIPAFFRLSAPPLRHLPSHFSPSLTHPTVPHSTPAAQVVREEREQERQLQERGIDRKTDRRQVVKGKRRSAHFHVFPKRRGSSQAVKEWGRRRTRSFQEWDYPAVGAFSREVCSVIFSSDPSSPLGVWPPGIQSHGADRDRWGAQGEEEDPLCRAILCAHQPGPSASGDGEQTGGVMSDPWAEDLVSVLSSDLFLCWSVFHLNFLLSFIHNDSHESFKENPFATWTTFLCFPPPPHCLV